MKMQRREFTSIEELNKTIKSYKKQISKWWTLIAVLIGFIVFAFTLNGLAKNPNMAIYLIFIQAAVTGGIIAFIVKAFEKAAFAILDAIADRKADELKKEEKEHKEIRRDVI